MDKKVNSWVQWVSVCDTCGAPIGWVECPTGGWWSHLNHPEDDHDAAPLALPSSELYSAEQIERNWRYNSASRPMPIERPGDLIARLRHFEDER